MHYVIVLSAILSGIQRDFTIGTRDFRTRDFSIALQSPIIKVLYCYEILLRETLHCHLYPSQSSFAYPQAQPPQPLALALVTVVNILFRERNTKQQSFRTRTFLTPSPLHLHMQCTGTSNIYPQTDTRYHHQHYFADECILEHDTYIRFTSLCAYRLSCGRTEPKWTAIKLVLII